MNSYCHFGPLGGGIFFSYRFCGLSFYVSAGSLLRPNPLGWLIKKKRGFEFSYKDIALTMQLGQRRERLLM